MDNIKLFSSIGLTGIIIVNLNAMESKKQNIDNKINNIAKDNKLDKYLLTTKDNEFGLNLYKEKYCDDNDVNRNQIIVANFKYVYKIICKNLIQTKSDKKRQALDRKGKVIFGFLSDQKENIKNVTDEFKDIFLCDFLGQGGYSFVLKGFKLKFEEKKIKLDYPVALKIFTKDGDSEVDFFKNYYKLFCFNVLQDESQKDAENNIYRFLEIENIYNYGSLLKSSYYITEEYQIQNGLLFKDKKKIDESINYLETEYFEYGDLNKFKKQICDKYELSGFPIALTVDIMYQLLHCLDVLFSRGFIHFDIKPSNICIDNFLNVKIIDFSTIKKYDTYSIHRIDEEGDTLFQFPKEGTAPFMSEEILKEEIIPERHLNKIDMWGFGIIMYLLHYGKNPFHVGNVNCDQAADNLFTKKLTFPEDDTPKMFKDFLSFCLVKGIQKRCNIGCAKKYPVFNVGRAIEGLRLCQKPEQFLDVVIKDKDKKITKIFEDCDFK